MPELAGKPACVYTRVHQSHPRIPVWAQALVVLGVWAVPASVLATLPLGSLNPVSKSQRCRAFWWEVQETL